MEPIKVGTEIFWEDGNDINEGVVFKVGREYIYAKRGGWREYKVRKENMKMAHYPYASCFLSRQGIVDSKQTEKNMQQIRQLTAWNGNKFTLSQTTRILEILNETK